MKSCVFIVDFCYKKMLNKFKLRSVVCEQPHNLLTLLLKTLRTKWMRKQIELLKTDSDNQTTNS